MLNALDSTTLKDCMSSTTNVVIYRESYALVTLTQIFPIKQIYVVIRVTVKAIKLIMLS